ncbi:MAG: DUF4157 domain-containing protein, partial [Pseudomonadota bacterium]
MTTAVAQTTKPPAHAAAPPVHKQPTPVHDTGEEAAPLIMRSLSAVPSVQRACAACDGAGDALESSADHGVQRRCAACAAAAEEEHSHVMPRLRVGAVNDPLEREADAIADRVMAMRDTSAATAQVAKGGPAQVNRACAACASRDDHGDLRRMPDIASVIAGEDERDVARMRTAGGQAAEQISASAGELTSGGQPLPSSTRHFFESRMARDLSDVRIHQGPSADALSDSISARAFTYRNHI